MVLDESHAYEVALSRWGTWCDHDSSCSLRGHHPLQAFTSLAARADRHPSPAPGCAKSAAVFGHRPGHPPGRPGSPPVQASRHHRPRLGRPGRGDPPSSARQRRCAQPTTSRGQPGPGHRRHWAHGRVPGLPHHHQHVRRPARAGGAAAPTRSAHRRAESELRDCRAVRRLATGSAQPAAAAAGLHADPADPDGQRHARPLDRLRLGHGAASPAAPQCAAHPSRRRAHLLPEPGCHLRRRSTPSWSTARCPSPGRCSTTDRCGCWRPGVGAPGPSRPAFCRAWARVRRTAWEGHEAGAKHLNGRGWSPSWAVAGWAAASRRRSRRAGSRCASATPTLSGRPRPAGGCSTAPGLMSTPA